MGFKIFHFEEDVKKNQFILRIYDLKMSFKLQDKLMETFERTQIEREMIKPKFQYHLETLPRHYEINSSRIRIQ